MHAEKKRSAPFFVVVNGGMPTSSDKAAANLFSRSQTRVGFLFAAPPLTWVTIGSWR